MSGMPVLITWRKYDVCEFIKIDKRILEWEWYKDKNTKILFFHFLLKANCKETKFRGLKLERGQFASSIASLSHELSLTANEVRTAINHLKSTGEITSKPHSKFTVFTVVCYDSCTSEAQAKTQTNHLESNKQNTSESHGDAQSINIMPTTQKEREFTDKIYYPNDEHLNASFKEFLIMRNKIKKPIATKQAMTRIRNKIENLSGGDNDLAIQILNQSTDHCWQDVYPLKEEKQPKNNNIFDEWRNA